MSTVVTRPRPHAAGTANGGVPARRAVIHWSWRLFRREWRQQLLVLALIVVAVGATVVAAAVAVNTPPAANAGFGTAHDLATFTSPGAKLAADIAAIQDKYGLLDVIENQALTIPGSIQSYDLRAQNPDGPFGQPMLSLLSGHYPAAADQVALTPGLAADLGLKVGDVYHQGAQARTVVGIVQNPQSLLDEFALVIPGQVTHPTAVSVLFDAPPGVSSSALGPNVQTPGSQTASNPLNPTTIVLALATIGMLLIALVSVGGFTVLAQRRLRALGMLGALGATDRNVRLVVRANGVVVGVVGALGGLVVGLAAWLAYRPKAEQSAHHLIGAFALPWVVIGPALALAVLATFFAASRPARAITRMSTVAALSGRPAPPKQVHRSALPGVLFAVIAVLALWYSGRSDNNGGGAPELVGGLVCLTVSVILLSPLFLAAMARAAKATPDRGPAGPARPGPLPGPLGIGAGRHRPRGDDRHAGLRPVRGPVRQRPGLRRAQPHQQPADRLHRQRRPRWSGPRRPRRPRQRRRRRTCGRRQPAVRGGHRGQHRRRARIARRHRAGDHQRRAAARRARPAVVRPGVRGHPAAAGRLRDQGLPGQPGRRHPVHAARPVRALPDAAHLREQRERREPGNGPDQTSFPCPAGQCLANPVIQQEGALPSGTLGPQYGDHPARDQPARPGLERQHAPAG